MNRRDRVEYISEERIWELLKDADDETTVRELVIILEYVNGSSLDSLSETYDVDKSTIRYWLDRFAFDTPEMALVE